MDAEIHRFRFQISEEPATFHGNVRTRRVRDRGKMERTNKCSAMGRMQNSSMHGALIEGPCCSVIVSENDCLSALVTVHYMDNVSETMADL